MTERWGSETEPEVRDWLELLPFRLYRRVKDKQIDRCKQPTTLREPYSRHLGGKLRELRFELDGEAVRIPYWVAPGQRIVLLTVFRKARMHEAAEVERAHQAQKVCEAEHGHVQRTYERRKELMQHSTWRTRRSRQLAGEAVEYDQEYVDARLASDLGQAVYNRRIELGLSQAELAEQAGMTELLGARRSG